MGGYRSLHLSWKRRQITAEYLPLVFLREQFYCFGKQQNFCNIGVRLFRRILFERDEANEVRSAQKDIIKTKMCQRLVGEDVGITWGWKIVRNNHMKKLPRPRREIQSIVPRMEKNMERQQGRKKKKRTCRDPGSNRGPLDLQSNALPTELSRHYDEPSSPWHIQ